MGPDSAKNIVSVSDFAKCLEVSEESQNPGGEGGGIPGENPYDGQTLSERGIFFRLQVYERLGFHYSKHNKGYGNLSFLSVKGLWRLKSKEN